MNFDTLAILDWRPLALIAVILVVFIGGLVLLLRENRNDLAGLRETLERDDDYTEGRDQAP